jgi:hypothetical protein
MADIDYIPTGFKQTCDICLLSSYSFVLGYYKKLNEGIQADINVHDVCKHYFSYFMSLIDARAELRSAKEFLDQEYRILPNPDICPKNSCIFEYFIFRILHHFCQIYQSDNIRGYEHIRDFDEYLRIQGNQIRSQNFIIEKMDARRHFLQDAYQMVKNHLDNGRHRLAMILFATGNGGHSVVVFKDDANGQYKFRDPNSLGLTDTVSHINIPFSDHLSISEYILFSAV